MRAEVVTLDQLPEQLRHAIAHDASRALCPRCSGGRSGEVSLSIAPERFGGLLHLHCWRVACGWRGYVFTGDVRMQHAQVKQAQPFAESTRTLLDVEAVHAAVAVKYHISRSTWATHGWAATFDGRLVMPVCGPYGDERGHMTRTFTKPKRVMAYKATAQPWADYWARPVPTCVLVEDQLSAARCYQAGYSATALLGTRVSIAVAEELASLGYARVVLALDRDAFTKSLKEASRVAHVLTLEPMCLEQDIKDLPTDEAVRQVIGAGHG